MNKYSTWMKSNRTKQRNSGKRKISFRILAAMLCFCVLFTTYPDILTVLSVFAAEVPEEKEIWQVSAFAPLPDEVGEQTVPAGTEPEKLLLPHTLEAVVTGSNSEALSENTGEQMDDGQILMPAEGEAILLSGNDINSNTGKTTEWEKTVSIEGISWNSQPVYDENTEGTYVFTAVLPANYILAQGVSLPQIIVQVTDMPTENVKLLVRPYDEENSSDMVYYLEGNYDNYSWEVYDGEAWQETGENGAELTVDKEQWYSWRFRCIAVKDGIRYIANAEDDWQIENFGIMTMAANGEDSSQSNYMYYDNGRRFNIRGIHNGEQIKTTYLDAGYRTASLTGRSKVEWSRNREISMGNSLYGSREISLVYNGRYAMIKYIVENRGSAISSFQVGSSADVMIYDNDLAPVTGTANGLSMNGEPKNSYQFNLIASTADTLWYGFYSKAYENIFTNLEDRSEVYSGDSGMAWSFSGTVAPGSTWSRYVLLGVGELPPAPQAPVLSNPNPQIKAGETSNITGTSQPGNTVCVEINGEEYSAVTGEDGTFSVPVLLPKDTPDGTVPIHYHAVSPEGGISPVVQGQAVVKGRPFMYLTDTEISVMEDSVLDDAWYRRMIKSSGGTVSYAASTVNTGKPGTYTVVYTARQTGYEDAAATLKITVLPLPLELSVVTAAKVNGKDSFTLSSSLKHAGAETISETGIVWGVMHNPTVELNNGKKSTSSAVTTKGGTISVTADSIVDGANYYARAYVRTSSGNVYYSPQKGFSINGKKFGTFSIQNNGNNTFTVTRTGGTDGRQEVYYRTVNGSAVGGVHFSHKAGTLIFEQGVSSLTITISEQGVAQQYGNNAATKYSNADRTYQVELYRVEGGGSLTGGTASDSRTIATRTMSKAAGYVVDRNVYGTYNVLGTDYSGKVTDSGYDKNPSHAFSMAPAYGSDNVNAYVSATAYAQALYLLMDVWEEDDGYQYIKFYTGDGTESRWKFEIKADGKAGNKRGDAHFPCSGTTGSANDVEKFLNENTSGNMPFISGEDYLQVPLSIQTLQIGFDASGTGNDDWRYENVRICRKPLDNQEPKLIGVADMAYGTYKPGDTITIALIFNEIVDRINSGTGLNSVQASTTWGNFRYAGGADTNVLYFTGTVPENATGTLTVNSITNAANIKDMCSINGTGTSGSGSTTVSVDIKKPSVTISNTSLVNGAAKAAVSGTNVDKLEYAWTQSSVMPVNGWLTAANGQQVTTRQTSGIWYLHVRGTYDSTGAMAHNSSSFNFGSGSAGQLPELTLSADNSAWAKSRTISITKIPASGAALSVKTPSGTTAAVSGTSYTATENGTYIFTLSAGDEKVVKSITVSRIDRTAPEAVISGPAVLSQSENVVLTVTPSDMGGAGIKTVTGTWIRTTNGGTAGNVTAALTKNSDGTYTAKTPGEEGNNYTYQLKVTVTDNAGNTNTVSSSVYTVKLKAPAVTVQRTASSRQGDTWSYQVTANGNTIIAIQLPDGTITTELNGTFKLTAAGTYYVVVSDAAGHVVRSSAMTAGAEVDGDAPVVRLYQKGDGGWTNKPVSIDVSVYEQGGIISAQWKKDGALLKTDLSCSVEEDSVYSGTFVVGGNGTYTVTVTDSCGNTGSGSIIVSNMDFMKPEAMPDIKGIAENSGWYADDVTVNLGFTDPVKTAGDAASGVAAVQYKWVSGRTVPESGLLSASGAQLEAGAFNTVQSKSGRWYLYYKVADKAGNETEGFSDEILIDKTAPVADLTNIIVENGTKNLWNWIIGKKSMIIKIPAADITDAFSGIAEVTYTAVPDSGQEQTRKIEEQDGYYQIALNEEFTGKIRLTIEDKAGNSAQVSLVTEDGRIVAEDYAPVITLTMPDTPEPNANGYYNMDFEISVTVTDDKSAENTEIASGGIAQIKWKDGENGTEQIVPGLPGTKAVYEKEFNIPVNVQGSHTYYVKAVDNAGNESEWKTVSVKLDTGSPVFNGEPAVKNCTQNGAEVAFAASESGRVYWITGRNISPAPEDVAEAARQAGTFEAVEGEGEEVFHVTGLEPGTAYTVYAVLEDEAGNFSQVITAGFMTLQTAPDLSFELLDTDYVKETVRVPEHIGEVEVYTNPDDPEGSRLPSNPDGSLSVEPGTSIYIRYPEKMEDGMTTPAGDSVKINIPCRPETPEPKQTTVTDTVDKGIAVTVTVPEADEEYILVKKGTVPDWSNPDTTGEFTGLEPCTEYELWVRKKATDDNFVSEPAKTCIKTPVTVKTPIAEGEGAGEDGNTAPRPATPDEDNRTVTFRGTYGEEYIPVIKVDGQEIIPEMTWDENDKKGGWEYNYSVPDGAVQVEGVVEFRKRTITGIAVTPDNLTIYADSAANGSMDTLTAYLKEACSVQEIYDNKTSRKTEAEYTTTDSFVPKGAVYSYTVSASGKFAGLILTVLPVTATVTAPAALMQVKKEGGYREEEVNTWLPAQAAVTYTGDGYIERTESRQTVWNTAVIDTGFGAEPGTKTIDGTVELPDWATGQEDISIHIEFVDKTILSDAQMELTISDWTYGERKEPEPRGKVSVTDESPVFTYCYSVDNGAAWITAESLPKSSGGYIIPGKYQVKMTYAGSKYTGVKTAAFTVEKKALKVSKGTLAVENRNYDGTKKAKLKAGGKPALSGILTGDKVTSGGSLTAVFTKTGPEKNIPVTVKGFVLKGRDAGCYALGNTSLTLRASIYNGDEISPPGGENDGRGDGSGGNDGKGDGSGGDSGNGSNNTPAPSNPPSVTPQPEAPSADTGAASGTGSSSREITETQQAQELTGQPEDRKEKGTDKAGQKADETGAASQEGSKETKTVPATVDNGRIAISGENISTGNMAGTEPENTALELGDGEIIVTVVCRDEKYAAGVKDTVAVANAVLTQEHIQLVKDGGTIEIRVDVKDISGEVPQQDKEMVESALAEYRKEIPGLTLGSYVDISMFIRVDKGSWDAVTSTGEPVEVELGIPKELCEDGREFYIIRSHEGENTMLNDLDSRQDTITISTGMFSVYAIVYADTGDISADAGQKCSLCHICPAFLGICCFIWLAVIIGAMLLGSCVIIWKSRKEKEEAE